MIAAVNNEADAEAGENGAVSTLEKLGTEADPPNESTPTTVTAAELAAVSGVIGVDGDNEAAYQAYINNNPDLFSSPATVAEVNAMIAAVNANEETGGEDSILVQIGTEADAGTGTPSTVTAAQLAALTGITGVDPDNEADYQQYIADNPDAFSQPATLAEVQAMIDAVNAAQTLPEGMEITNADQNKYVVSIFDTDYEPAPDPLPAATLATIAGDGTPDNTVDIQGVIGALNSGDELTVTLNYTATDPVDYPAFSQTISIPSSLIEGGGGPIGLTLSYDAGTTVIGDGTITATIAAASTLNVKQLDLYGGGLSATTPGYPLAAFSLSTNSSGGAGNVGVRIMTGIPDREFGDGAHDFLYLPVVAEDGNTWLNNNLGADYSNVNHASFDPTQQATAFDDHLAYGSLYQWGRFSDGHELITWSSETVGTPVNGTTSTRANIPGHSDFINVSGDWRVNSNNTLWANESSTNNPCPQGYRLPTGTEQTDLVTAASITNYTNAASSNLAFSAVGYRYNINATLGDQTNNGYYWSSTVTSSSAYVHYFASNSAQLSFSERSFGFSVRCIKD